MDATTTTTYTYNAPLNWTAGRGVPTRNADGNLPCVNCPT